MTLYERQLKIVRRMPKTEDSPSKVVLVMDWEEENKVLGLYNELKKRENSKNLGQYILRERFVPASKERLAHFIQVTTKSKNVPITYNNKTYPPVLVLKFGTDMAHLWGGRVIDFSVDTINETIHFACAEHDEVFKLEASFLDLDNWAETNKVFN